jgi:RNA polymerase primary sigma factor
MGGLNSDSSDGDVNSRIQSLIRLARGRGYVALQDIKNILPETVTSAQEIENVMNILENLDIEILDADEVEQYQSKIQDELREPSGGTSEIIEDPVRMYLGQMGQIPLLTRDQEVAISKRIEREELKAQDELFSIHLTAGFQINLADKLLQREERFDRVVLDKKIESRDAYYKMLTRAVQDRRMLLENVRSMWETIQNSTDEAEGKKLNFRRRQFQPQLKIVLKRFCFKMKMVEELLVDLKADLREIEQLYADLERSKEYERHSRLLN